MVVICIHDDRTSHIFQVTALSQRVAQQDNALRGKDDLLVEENHLRLAAETGLPETRKLLAAAQRASAEATAQLETVAAERVELREALQTTKRSLALMRGQLSAQEAEISEHARAAQDASCNMANAQLAAKARIPFPFPGLLLGSFLHNVLKFFA